MKKPKIIMFDHIVMPLEEVITIINPPDNIREFVVDDFGESTHDDLSQKAKDSLKENISWIQAVKNNKKTLLSIVFNSKK